MEVTPKTFRDVEFREKMRGYHPEDVDQFLEQAAIGVEQLHERLRQALERAQRAEAAAAEGASSGTSDETLKRTLVLAQRTADLAVQEAREQAARIVSSAEQQARAVVADAEERARRTHSEALADVRTELAKLEAVRGQAQQEVDILRRWSDEQRAHLVTTLQDALTMIERSGVAPPPPASTPIELPRSARGGELDAGPAVPGYGRDESPARRDDSPVRRDEPQVRRDEPQVRRDEPAHDREDVPAAGMSDRGLPSAPREPEPPGPEDGTMVMSMPPGPGGGVVDPDEDALDSFFEDNDFDDDRRFGGRLRRRR